MGKEQAAAVVQTPEPAAVWMAFDRLKPWPKNPKKHPPAQKKRICDAIIRLGWGAVVLAREADLEVIAGHGRLETVPMLKRRWSIASAEEKKTWSSDARRVVEKGEVPVRLLGLDEANAHIMALADNRMAEEGEDDPELLAEVMRNMTLDQTSLAGYQPDDLNDLFGDEDEEDEEDAKPKMDGLRHQVVVDVDDEDQQTALLERLEAEGFTCKPLVL